MIERIHRRRMRLELEALADGSLPEVRRAQLLRHLERCPGCAAEVERLTELDQLFASACPRPIFQAPDASRALFLRALATAGIEPRPARQQWGQWGWGAVAALLIGSAGTVAVLHGRSQPPAVPRATTTAARSIVSGVPETEPVPAPVWVRRRVASAGDRPVRRRRRHHSVSVPRLANHTLERGEVREAHAAPVIAAKPPEPVLHIELVAGRPEPRLQVTSCSTGPETPGYARVAGWRTSPSGEVVWSQTIVATGASAPQVALLPVSFAPDAD